MTEPNDIVEEVVEVTADDAEAPTGDYSTETPEAEATEESALARRSSSTAPSRPSAAARRPWCECA